MYKVSLRSNGLNVANVAQAYGGGGHALAGLDPRAAEPGHACAREVRCLGQSAGRLVVERADVLGNAGGPLGHHTGRALRRVDQFRR